MISTLYLCHLLFSVLQLTRPAQANTEKTIFLAPPLLNIPTTSPSLSDLYLISLSPSIQNLSAARTHINATFPTDASPKGSTTWVLLENLSPGSRYEVRVCWLATVRIAKQPTEFTLSTYTLATTFDEPDLITAVSTYAYARQAELPPQEVQKLLARRRQTRGDGDESATRDSILFLRIDAAADYFSLNETLMAHVPPVLVDIILDPYVLNIFPRSLGPTAVHVAVSAVLAWFVSGWIWQYLKGIAVAGAEMSAERDMQRNRDVTTEVSGERKEKKS